MIIPDAGPSSSIFNYVHSINDENAVNIRISSLLLRIMKLKQQYLI